MQIDKNNFANELTILGLSKIKYAPKIMKLFTWAFSRAVAQHSALRAPPGGAESTKLSIGRGFSSDGT